MNKVEESTYINAFKPFDVVETRDGSVGIIVETNINSCQSGFDNQVSYAIEFLVCKSGSLKNAWWYHSELTYHSNLMNVIAKQMTCNHGSSKEHYGKLLNIRNKI